MEKQECETWGTGARQTIARCGAGGDWGRVCALCANACADAAGKILEMGFEQMTADARV